MKEIVNFCQKYEFCPLFFYKDHVIFFEMEGAQWENLPKMAKNNNRGHNYDKNKFPFFCTKLLLDIPKTYKKKQEKLATN